MLSSSKAELGDMQRNTRSLFTTYFTIKNINTTLWRHVIFFFLLKVLIMAGCKHTIWPAKQKQIQKVISYLASAIIVLQLHFFSPHQRLSSSFTSLADRPDRQSHVWDRLVSWFHLEKKKLGFSLPKRNRQRNPESSVHLTMEGRPNLKSRSDLTRALKTPREEA